MSMSTHIAAFMPDTNTEFQKHKKILLMCSENNVSLPKETAEYFGQESQDYIDEPQYLLDQKLEIELKENVHYKEWSEEGSRGFEVDLSKLPKGITKLRFFNNW